MSLVRFSDKRKPIEIALVKRRSRQAPAPRFEPNILDEEGFLKAAESVLLRAGLGGRRRVALSIPDPLARIAVMEIPDPPRSSAELVEFLKFRMKKSLPFDVEHARVAFERLPGPVPTFLTGVMHEAVVSQYEDVFTRLGFHVGLVLPASVSLLQLLRPLARRELAPGADYFFVNAERDYFSVSLVRDRDLPALTRTLGVSAEDGVARIYSEEDLLQSSSPPRSTTARSSKASRSPACTTGLCGPTSSICARSWRSSSKCRRSRSTWRRRYPSPATSASMRKRLTPSPLPPARRGEGRPETWRTSSTSRARRS
jgi:hypothetical protein